MLASKHDQTESAPREPIHVAGTILDLVISVAALAAFNLIPDRIGIYWSMTDPTTFTPVLGAARSARSRKAHQHASKTGDG